MRQKSAPKVANSRHRRDIQGIRAICMAQVLLYHAWTIGSPIGVDSFIMISAYLMTSSFVRRAESGKMPFFVERWGNTFKRLLPPLALVVVATLGASFYLLPATRWSEMIRQAFASLTYWENWELVRISTDYYALDKAMASPFQHLWSMSMQGQVFLLWPLLMTVCVFVAHFLERPIRELTAIAFVILAATSLGWLLLQSPMDGAIYFDTRSRLWEFALGSAIASVAPWIRIPKPIGALLSWLGLIVLVVFCLVPIGTYPGPMAAVPMLSVSAMLLFASEDTPGSVGRMLATTPLVALGDISYAVYLVHWPIFVFYLVMTEQESLGALAGIALILISIVVAWLLTRLVDDPLRHWKWSNESINHKYAVVGLSLGFGLLPVLFLSIGVSRAQDVVVDIEEAVAEYPGAASIVEGAVAASDIPVKPGPLDLPKQWASLGAACDDDLRKKFPTKTAQQCFQSKDYGDSEQKIFVAGSSHAQQQLISYLGPLVDGTDWDARAVIKGGCTLGAPSSYDDECAEWNQKVIDHIMADRPDYLMLVVTRASEDSPEEGLVPGIEPLIEQLTSQGIRVVGVRDNLRSKDDLYECELDDSYEASSSGCILARERYFPRHSPAEKLTTITGFDLIDMTDAYCEDNDCPTVVGNVAVYMDSNHVTRDYARSVAPYFLQRFHQVSNAAPVSPSRGD